MAIKERHRRDFWTYVRCFRRWRGMPSGVGTSFEKGPQQTIRAFVQLDSTGALGSGPIHPRVLRAAVIGKRQLNLQIREWASGYADCGAQSWLVEVRGDIPWLPDWVWEAVVKQHYAQ